MSGADRTGQMERELKDERTALVEQARRLKREISEIDRKEQSVRVMKRWIDYTAYVDELSALRKKYKLSDAEVKEAHYIHKYRVGRRLTDDISVVEEAGISVAEAEKNAEKWYADLAWKATRKRRSTKRKVDITSERFTRELDNQVAAGKRLKSDMKRTDTSVGRGDIKGTI